MKTRYRNLLRMVNNILPSRKKQACPHSRLDGIRFRHNKAHRGVSSSRNAEKLHRSGGRTLEKT